MPALEARQRRSRACRGSSAVLRTVRMTVRMPNPSPTASRSSPARRAASARDRARARAGRRACGRGRPHGRRARGARRRDPRGRRHARPWCRSTSRTTPASTGSARRSHERYGRLDVLVGNAGILGPLSPLGHVEPKVWDDVMAVNVTANWRLIRVARPAAAALRRRPRGVPHLGRRRACAAYWGPYAVSKAALEALARTYAAETATTQRARQPVQSRADPHPHARRPPCRAKTR